MSRMLDTVMLGSPTVYDVDNLWVMVIVLATLMLKTEHNVESVSNIMLGTFETIHLNKFSQHNATNIVVADLLAHFQFCCVISSKNILIYIFSCRFSFKNDRLPMAQP